MRIKIMGLSRIHKWFLVFGLRLIAIYLVFFISYLLISLFGGFHFVNLIEANIAYFFVKLAYPLVQIDLNVISNLVVNGTYSNFAVSIDDICLGWFPIAGFSAMILALPKIKIKKKLNALKFGIPILFAANILRIIIVIFAAAFFGLEGFDFFHLFVVKFDLMILIVALFLYSAKKIIGKKELQKSIESF
ncbi:MAG: exosortase/archaeosortase family protein [Candidatus Diapherotrites archaeon]